MLALLLMSCRVYSIGQAEPPCVVLSSTALAPDEPGSLGRSANDVVAALEAEPLTVELVRPDIAVEPERFTTTVSLQLTVSGAIAEQEREPRADYDVFHCIAGTVGRAEVDAAVVSDDLWSLGPTPSVLVWGPGEDEVWLEHNAPASLADWLHDDILASFDCSQGGRLAPGEVSGFDLSLQSYPEATWSTVPLSLWASCDPDSDDPDHELALGAALLYRSAILP